MIYVGKKGGEEEEGDGNNLISKSNPTTMEVGPDSKTSAALASTQNSSHMVFAGGDGAGAGAGANATDKAEEITVSEKNGGEELEIALGGNGAKNESANVVIDSPKQTVVLQNNVSIVKDETVEGKTIISESVHIVNKPVNALTEGNVF